MKVPLAPRRFSQRRLRQRVEALPWFHQIDFGNGVVSPGATPLDVLQRQADLYFKDGVAGRSVLDIGCWDGFNSFEAKRRGAARVLATDHFAWSEACWGSRDSFELAREQLGAAVEVMDVDIPELDPDSIGTFDVVLFCGVLYHLRNPFAGLEHVAKLAAEVLVVETHLDALDLDRPAMIFYPGTELGNDHTNWWGPNAPCVIAMLKDVGFARIDYEAHPIYPSRGIFHGYR